MKESHLLKDTEEIIKTVRIAFSIFFILFTSSASMGKISKESPEKARQEWNSYINSDNAKEKKVIWSIQVKYFAPNAGIYGSICGYPDCKVLVSLLSYNFKTTLSGGEKIMVTGVLFGKDDKKKSVFIRPSLIGLIDDNEPSTSSTNVTSQSIYKNLVSNLTRYIRHADPNQLMPTGDNTQLLYSAQSYTSYGCDWSLVGTFKMSDGNLDHLTFTKILSVNPVESYKSILSILQSPYNFRLVDAPSRYEALMSSITSEGNQAMAAMKSFVDVKFFISAKIEPELLKIIGLDNTGVCYIVKFPMAELPDDIVPYKILSNGSIKMKQ